MVKDRFQYIFGPVFSWRLGRSLGIDPLSGQEKVCNFNCIYCQLGDTPLLTAERKEFVPVRAVIDELNRFPPVDVDYYTFSSNGEPTLAKNLGEMIRAIKQQVNGKVAVITNGGLIDRQDVRDDLSFADFVLVKLDACTHEIFYNVSRPDANLDMMEIIQGIKIFRAGYHGKLGLQMMFVEANKDFAPQMAKIAREIAPDEIQINTPLRPCGVEPLNKEEMDIIKGYFEGLNIKYVYDIEQKDVKPINPDDTSKRHGQMEE